MARSQARWSQGRVARRRAILIASVVAFLIVDIVLIALLVTRDDGAASDRVPGPIPTFGISPSPIPAPTPTPNPVQSLPRQMEAASATEVWRASTGSCAGATSVIEHSFDGGQTWQQVGTPGIDVRQVLQIDPLGESTVRLAARVGADCAVGSFASFTAGEFWGSYPENLPEFVYLDGAVVVAGQPLTPPCAPVTEVQRLEDSVVAVCADVLAELDEGSGAWATLGVPGLLAATSNGEGYTLAVWGAGECAGLSIQSVVSPVDGTAPAVLGCAAAETDPAEVTLAQFDNSVWLWSRDRLRVSSDNGASWN